MKVAIYSRVSTTDQNVLQQSKFLRNWCIDQGHLVIVSVLDQESGTLPLIHRKQFNKLLNHRNTYDAIVIQSLDRLTRNWADQYYLESYFTNHWSDLKLISTSEPIDFSTSNGRAMFRFKMIMSCMQPEETKERQRIGIERAIREGKFTGRKKGSKNKK